MPVPGDASGGGAAKNIEARIKQLRNQVEETTSDYDREKIAGAPGEAVRRRGDYQSRRGDRDGDEREKSSRGRRAACDPCRGGGRHRTRRGRYAASRCDRA